MITSEWLSEHGTSVIVQGELDLDTAPLLAAELERQIADGHRHLVIDLTDTAFLDSTSLGTLIRAVQPLQDEPDATVVLAGASGVVARALLTSGIGQLFTMLETREEAERAVGRSDLNEGWREVRRPDTPSQPSTASVSLDPDGTNVEAVWHKRRAGDPDPPPR